MMHQFALYHSISDGLKSGQFAGTGCSVPLPADSLRQMVLKWCFQDTFELMLLIEVRANPTASSSQIKLQAVAHRKPFFTFLSMTPSSLFLNRFTVHNTSLQMSTDSLMYFDVLSLRRLKLLACSLKNISAYILEKDQVSGFVLEILS